VPWDKACTFERRVSAEMNAVAHVLERLIDGVARDEAAGEKKAFRNAGLPVIFLP